MNCMSEAAVSFFRPAGIETCIVAFFVKRKRKVHSDTERKDIKGLKRRNEMKEHKWVRISRGLL